MTDRYFTVVNSLIFYQKVIVNFFLSNKTNHQEIFQKKDLILFLSYLYMWQGMANVFDKSGLTPYRVYTVKQSTSSPSQIQLFFETVQIV